MNEYEPKPSRVLPLEYAGPNSRREEPGSFVAGCMTSLALVIGLPFIFGSIADPPNGPALAAYGLLLAVVINIVGIIWSFVKGKNKFARGLIWGPLMIVCLILLLAGVCALIFMGH